jgi:hypothetical protein
VCDLLTTVTEIRFICVGVCIRYWHRLFGRFTLGLRGDKVRWQRRVLGASRSLRLLRLAHKVRRQRSIVHLRYRLLLGDEVRRQWGISRCFGGGIFLGEIWRKRGVFYRAL